MIAIEEEFSDCMTALEEIDTAAVDCPCCSFRDTGLTEVKDLGPSDSCGLTVALSLSLFPAAEVIPSELVSDMKPKLDPT